MLSMETIEKVLNLPKPVRFVGISTSSCGPIQVSIYFVTDAPLAELFNLVKEIFPESVFKAERREVEIGGNNQIWTQFNFVKKGEYELSINHYETKKESPELTEDKENSLSDYTSNEVMAQ